MEICIVHRILCSAWLFEEVCYCLENGLHKKIQNLKHVFWETIGLSVLIRNEWASITKYSEFLYKKAFCKEWCIKVIGKKFRLCCVCWNNTFWVRGFFVFTSVNMQHGILLLIQNSKMCTIQMTEGCLNKHLRSMAYEYLVWT